VVEKVEMVRRGYKEGAVDVNKNILPYLEKVLLLYI
jgi:hypothetical protein